MAKRKIYDITPPKVANKIENTIKAMAVDNTRKVASKSPKKASKKASAVLQSPQFSQLPKMPQSPPPLALPEHTKRRFPFKEIFVGGVVIVLLLGIYLYNKLPKADITIVPKTEALSLQENITADASAHAVDFENKVIPAQYIEIQQNGQQEFQATGSASNDGKAAGTIKIYNKISPATAFTLKTGTHFLSDSGKYFVTLDKVIIPGAKGSTPGSVSVSVQAEESGADYNIGASKFSVPKLSGTSYYYSIWGESVQAMSGGYTGKVKKVTKDNLTGAKDMLTKQLLAKAEESLRSRLSGQDMLLDEAIARNVVDANADAKEGAVTDTFHESATVKISALIFKKQDVEEFARKDIMSQLPATKNFTEKSLNISYASQSVDVKSKTEMLNIQFSANTYYHLDTTNLVDLLGGKSADQIKQVIDQQYVGKSSELKVDFWPFWVKSAPTNKNRIKINLNFAQ